jgi:DnaJ-class molecular chaperone
MNPYDTLGVDKEADDDTIKRAYRKRANKAHPDKDGGDAEVFHQITCAYDLLSDPKRRAHYDKTGDTTSEHERLANDLVLLVHQALEEIDVAKVDLFAHARKMVMNAVAANKTNIEGLSQKIDKLHSAIKRIKRKGTGENAVAIALKHVVKQHENNMQQLIDTIAYQHKLLALLDEYEYQVDKVQVVAVDPFTIFHSARGSW